MYGYIYKIIFPIGSFKNTETESFYIGQKKSNKIVETYFGSGRKVSDWFKKRNLSSRNCKPQKAEKLGIKREILAKAESYEELNRLEYEYIEKSLNNIACLNLISGGKMPNMTKELRKKISEKTKEAMTKNETYKKYIKSHREYYIKNKEEISKIAKERAKKTKNYNKMNEKNRQKNIEQWSNKEMHEERRKKMAAKTGKKVLCIETGHIFDSANNAQKILNIPPHVLDVCNGNRRSVGGMHFIFVV